MAPETTQALQSTALIGAVVRPLVVTVLLIGLWVGLDRAGRKPTQRLLTWSAGAVFLIAWLTAAWTFSARGVFASAANTGLRATGTHILLPMILVAAAALILVTRSKAMTATIDAVPLWWLVAFQAYRITGFVFLRLWAAGFLPGYFALPAGIGDSLTGLFAVGTALALWRQSPRARTLAYAVNIFGLADLINAVSMGLLTAVKSPAGVSAMSVYPLSIVPTFGVPLAFIVHCLSLWQLKRRSQRSTGEKLAYRDDSLKQVEA